MNNQSDLFEFIASVLHFSDEEKNRVIDEYNYSLNLKLLELTTLSADQLKEIIAQSKNSTEAYMKILSSIKSKETFIKDFKDFLDSFHKEFFTLLYNSADEEQKKKLSEYLSSYQKIQDQVEPDAQKQTEKNLNIVRQAFNRLFPGKSR